MVAEVQTKSRRRSYLLVAGAVICGRGIGILIEFIASRIGWIIPGSVFYQYSMREAIFNFIPGMIILLASVTLEREGRRISWIVAVIALGASIIFATYAKNNFTSTNSRATKLIVDTERGDVQGVKLDLEQEHVSPDVTDYRGVPAIMWASFLNHTEIVKLLLDHGATVDLKSKVGDTSLIDAAITGHADIVRLLLAHGADINVKAGRGMTPLMASAVGGDTAVTQLLLSKGADIKATSDIGYTVLTVAADYGRIGVIKILLAAGAKWNDRPANTRIEDVVCKDWKDSKPCPKEEILKTVP